uniref:NADH-ubiquinone oxidoreductase chain 1 n=1 Tax=Ophiura sarsii TaxID=861515 RepID=A0A5J6BT34_9ECHI|nr:NADH dehydrogenase subunit 1 [Ophiura sarsii]QEP94708.1 NADH dehydrogenase subunit 1 [Ophiura sarsii]QHT54205.1 NADH dehydrogenase subunit 1 [Ophiura sarsii]QYF07891.1 NADH dehydrogenase subunit 1 [Ophiura sarsii]
MINIIQALSEMVTNLFLILNLILFIIPVLVAVALLTLLERKTLGYMQFRKGPNLVGPLGLLQPFADGMKLFIKENFKPSNSTPLLFAVAPPLFFFLSILIWSVAPIYSSALNFTLSLLFIITFSSLSVYAILGAGWASNSKYALLGALRAVAQTISYEVSFGLILLPLVLFVGGWNLLSFSYAQELGIWILIPCFPLFIMWFISSLAETNRTPFDLAEGESELVSGYNVEYAGAPFALFFIGEYANIIFINLLTVVLFLGTITHNMVLVSFFFTTTKVLFLVFVFLWIRASFPRIRYDQLMGLMWKAFLPMTISLLVFYFLIIILFNNIPLHY